MCSFVHTAEKRIAAMRQDVRSREGEGIGVGLNSGGKEWRSGRGDRADENANR